MEIQSLRVLITEQDLTAIALEALRGNEQVSDVHVRITPEVVVIAGTYRMMMRVSFETHWGVGVHSGRLAVTLRDLRAGGFGAGMLKGLIMSLLESHAEQEDGIEIKGETIFVHPDKLMAKRGLQIQTNLTCVTTQAGALVLISERAEFALAVVQKEPRSLGSGDCSPAP